MKIQELALNTVPFKRNYQLLSLFDRIEQIKLCREQSQTTLETKMRIKIILEPRSKHRNVKSML